MCVVARVDDAAPVRPDAAAPARAAVQVARVCGGGVARWRGGEASPVAVSPRRCLVAAGRAPRLLV